MRTREEQIEEIMDKLSEGHPVAIRKTMAEGIIHEAEQRVRAEIGRDSARLDWLLSRTHYGIPGFDPKVSGRDPSERKEALIRAIDAAMEGGK